MHVFKTVSRTFGRLSCAAILMMVAHDAIPQEVNTKIDASVGVYRDTNNQIVYRIHFDYKISDRRTVYIDNIGVVPAQGGLTYFSYDSSIVFRTSQSGRVLAQLSPLQSGAFTTFSKGPDFPDESEFSKAYRTGVWRFRSSFQIVANETLNKSFPSGYKAYSAADLNYIETTFTRLKELPPNLLGEIAILVSHPYDSTAGRFQYRIQYAIREKRIQSSAWRSEISDATRQSAERFIGDLIDWLEAEGTKRK